MQILETERLILREFNLEDAAFILELLNTPTWLKFIGDRKVHSIDDAKNYLLNGSMKSYAENGFGFYAVVEKTDTSDRTNQTIGMCGLIKRDALPDIDIGFAFLPNLISKGFGYEIASATLDYAFNILKINRIIAIVNPENKKSIGLIKKIGMQFEEMIKLGDDDKELMLFGIKQKVD
jgi:[ribosomal protein S5]-alanine N-acetyltransferase